MARPRREGRGQLSAIERLPEACTPAIAAAAAALAERSQTQTEIYQEFFAALQAVQAEHRGELEFAIPSFSAFNRFSIKQALMTRRLDDTRRIAEAIAERFDAEASDDLTLIAAEAIKTLVFELLTDAGEAGIDPKGAMNLANALRAAAQAQGVSTARREKVEASFAKEVDAAVETVVREKGMSAETAEAIKAKILGVKG